MTRNDIIAGLMREYEAVRQADEDEADRHIREIDTEIPEIAALKAERAALLTGAARKLALSPASGAVIGEQLKTKGIEIGHRIKQLLTEHGYPDDYLDVHYKCPKCHDTGYIGDINVHMCDCFEKKLTWRLYSDAGLDPSGSQRFESFREDFVPDDMLPGRSYTQRYLAKRIKQCCEAYADAYPVNDKPNMLLIGGGGLGKTFMINAIAARLIERGYAPLRISAHRLNDAMRKRHYRSEEDNDDMDTFINAPALFIDDLGSEPMISNVTVEYLYLILNERCAARRHTVIATNLDPLQLNERYFERVTSRLFDKNLCSIYRFEGKDLRRNGG